MSELLIKDVPESGRRREFAELVYSMLMGRLSARYSPDVHLEETAHGWIITATIKVKHGERFDYQAPRFTGDEFALLMGFGICRWVQGTGWQDGHAIALAF